MQEKEALIDLYDNSGFIIETKKRSEIDKTTGILKGVYVLLTNNRNHLFFIKPKDTLWKDKWGSSCAGFVRSGEMPSDAAKRTVKRELRLTPELKQIYEGYHEFNNIKRFIHVFYGLTPLQPKPNSKDIVEGRWFSADEIKHLAEKDNLIPTNSVALKALNII